MHFRIRAAAWFFALAALGRMAAGAEDAGTYRVSVGRIMALATEAAPAPRAIPPRRVAPRQHLRVDPESPRGSLSPAPETAVGPTIPLAVGTSFLGATLADTGAFPPDTMGAAGPTQFLVGVNGRIRTFTKASGTSDGVLDVDLDTFFASVRNGSGTGTPRVRYDRLSARWFVTALNFTATNNRVLVAVTDAASNGVISGATVWTYWFFQHNLDLPSGDTDTFLDSASLGVDANALVIGGNVFDGAGAFQGVTVHAIRKSDVLTGNGGNLAVGGTARAFRNLTGTPTGSGPYAPQGVDNLFDATSLASWVVGVDNAGFGTLVLRRLAYGAPGAWPPASISANLPLTVAATALPLSVPHAGNLFGADGELDALDDRLSSASLRGGHVWTAHNIAIDASGAAPGDRDGSRWYEIDVSTGTPSLVQSGTLFDAAATDPRFYWMPAIAVSGQGHAVIGASVAGAAAAIDAAAAGRLAGDAPGTLQAPSLLTAASAAYNPAGDPGPPRRWGDYSFTSVDPADDMTLWTIQQFCDAADSYGVQVAAILAPPPATPVSATPSSVASGLASVSVDITGASTLGSGFFDPGAGFPRHLQASVPGGVTINAVTYASPTSITLDLNTVGAASGTRPIAVTNPDGQVASGLRVLTLVGGGSPLVSAIVPTSGAAAGGTAVVLTGSNFGLDATISVGGVAGTAVAVSSGTTAGATTPALTPGTLNAVTLVNTDLATGTLLNGWLADFLDVGPVDIFHGSVEKLIRHEITAGCGGGLYCRDSAVTRAQMAVFLLKAKLGPAYAPPPCSGTVFTDVHCDPGGIFDPWIEDLAARGISAGCGPDLYCPALGVTRAQMSVLLLKASLGATYLPPDCSGTVFVDVPCDAGGIFDPWIEDLAARGITGGCGAGIYCAGSAATRGQMAAFLVKAFGLP